VKFLIVNADDFGYGAAINRGIVEAVDRGIVTSAGLMVNTPGTREAVALAAGRPQLSLGLHANFTNEAQRLVEFDEPEVCRAELRRQFDSFCQLVGRPPTHLDSHQHIHRRRPCQQSFRELAAEHGLPLRDQAPVTFKGGFYGQWEYGVSDPSKVSYAALTRILGNELVSGVYELACHPGYFDAEAEYVYHRERELELGALLDRRFPAFLREHGIRLIGYHDLRQAVSALHAG
jgi:predicted glycoside hydrolase/deacetylase ChbG (UPF0249 family)